MHDYVRHELFGFIMRTQPDWPTPAVADLGALDLNGSARAILPGPVTGFDIVPGPGVDVVLEEPGAIPKAHRHKYGAVVAVSSFQFCGDPVAFRWELSQLLAPGGRWFVSMCGSQCRQKHSTSANPYHWGDELRWSYAAFVKFWTPALCVTRLSRRLLDHFDFIAEGTTRP